MLRSGLSLLCVIAALLAFAVLAGSDAQAGGVGHRHGPVATAAVDHAPVASAADERTRHHGPSPHHSRTTESGAAGEPPCGGGHGDDGSMCCGVACHAAMPATEGPPGFVPAVGAVESRFLAENRRERLVLLIERPPRG